MPDIRRLREEIKPSETDEGDGVFNIIDVSIRWLLTWPSNLLANCRHTYDQCLHQETEIQTENLSCHQRQRSNELGWIRGYCF